MYQHCPIRSQTDSPAGLKSSPVTGKLERVPPRHSKEETGMESDLQAEDLRWPQARRSSPSAYSSMSHISARDGQIALIAKLAAADTCGLSPKLPKKPRATCTD